MEYPKGYVEGLPNCGIVAIASITGADYNEVWNWFKRKRNRRGQWRGSTSKYDYDEAFKQFGKNDSFNIFTARKTNTKIGQQRPIPLHYWVSIYRKKFPGKKFIVCSTNHTMAVDEHGNVLDQSGIGPASEHKSKGRRITDAWIVE